MSGEIGEVEEKGDKNTCYSLINKERKSKTK